MPEKICLDCLNQVLSASEIKRKAIDTDRLLRIQIKVELTDEHQSGLDDPMIDLHQIAELSFLSKDELDQNLPQESIKFPGTTHKTARRPKRSLNKTIR